MTDAALSEHAAAAADWMRHGEALLAAALAGEPDITARVDLLAPRSAPAIRRQVACCALIALVNGQHYELARRFAETEDLWALALPGSANPPQTLTDEELQALFCLAQLDLAGGEFERALMNFGRLQKLLPLDHLLQRASAESEANVLARLGRAIQITWPSPAAPLKTLAMDCPNCAATTPKPEVCTVNAHLPGRDVVSGLLRCPECSCIFLERGHELAYHEDYDVSGDVLAFYIQLAAGILPITRPLARVRRPPGTRYIDVGCGFGFGLDFALHELGWSGRGLDPSPMARGGAEQLKVPIESRYFTAADAVPPAEVVMASEVLEHVAEPRQFMKMLRDGIMPGGVLIITTPNGDAVRPETPSGILMPVLSIGAHLVLQTAESLEWLLHDAGLTHVVVEQTPISLIAFASDRPLELENSEPKLRAAYRSYLKARLASSARGTDLWLGFATRTVDEAIADHDAATADATLAMVAEELRQRYGIDLDDPGTLPALTTGMSSEQLRRVAPFNIANLLFLRAQQRREAGDQTARLGDIFFAAAQSARTVRRVLAAMNADDHTVASVEHGGSAQATLIAARLGSEQALERLAFALASLDGAAQPPLRHLADDTLAALLKARAYRLARRLRAAFPSTTGPRGRLADWMSWVLAGCRRFAQRALRRG